MNEEENLHDQKCSRITQTKLKKSLLSKGAAKSTKLSKCTKDIGVKRIFSLKEDLPCGCQKHSWESYTNLKSVLPPGYDYRVCSFHGGDDGGFKCMLRLPHLTADKVNEWKSKFEDISFCLFRVCRTFPGSGRYNSFKMDYSCQHNASRGRGKLSTKKTGCKSELSITVKRVVKKSRSRDRHLPELPTSIFLRWHHNHPLDGIESTRCHDVNDDTRREFVSLYSQGCSPASAYIHYRSKLMKENGENFTNVAKDRRILPEKQYVYRLFAKIRKKKELQKSNEMAGFESILKPPCASQPVDVILPAAGSSTRMGTGASQVPKQFQKVLGTHLIAYTIACFHSIPWIRHIVLVVNPTQENFALELGKTYGWSKVRVCPGSHTRHRSIWQGVKTLRGDCSDANVIIIHDGARPFVSEDIIRKVSLAAEKHGAAGVVRPLVSTVIKPDHAGMLESTLTRSDYHNSEMPQAFQYSVIATAYEKCGEQDLDHGTECLLLALTYSRCPANLVEGNPDLWKVTYAKDLFTMESVVKERFTRVSIMKMASHLDPVHLESLKSSLEERGTLVCKCDSDGANTLICFVNLPSSMPSSSTTSSSSVSHLIAATDLSRFKEAAVHYKQLGLLECRLGLYIILIFQPQPQSDTFTHQPLSVPRTNQPTTNHRPSMTETNTSATAKGESTFLPPTNQPTTPLHNTRNPLPSQHHQQQQQQMHHHHQPQQPLHPVQPCHHQQYQHHLSDPNVLSSTVLPRLPVLDHFEDGQHHHYNDSLFSSIQSFKCGPPSQALVENDSSPFHFYPQPYSSEGSSNFSNNNNSNNNNHHPAGQIGPPSHPLTHQSHHPHDHLVHQQQQQYYQQQHLPRPTLSKADSTNHTHIPFEAVHNVSVSNLHQAQNISDRSLNHIPDGTISNNNDHILDYLTHDMRFNSGNEVEKSLTPTNLLCSCQVYMKELRQTLKKTSDVDACIISIVNHVKADVTDKVVELVWNRSRVLDGQVLMMMD